MDKVYIDGPHEFLIRGSIDKLLADYFCNQEIPGPNRTVNILVRASKTTAYVLEPHGLSIYTLSMYITFY